MPLYKIVAIALLVAGTLGLIYGGFNIPTDTHEADIGSLSVSIAETEHVNVPIWAGIAAIVMGAALLVLPKRK